MRFFRSLFVVVCLLFPSVVAIAQTPNAAITGFIDDPSKAVIPQVSVTAINTQTGARTQTFTNKEGVYALPALPPGSYRVEVDKQGFRGIIEEGITLHVQDLLQLNFHMAVGSMSESVTVNADGININTTDGSVGTVIDRTFVENIPLNGRSFQDLILLTPGVVTQSPQNNNQALGGNGDFSVNGQRTESNSYMVDGVSANNNPGNGAPGPAVGGNIPASTALGTTQSIVSVDALQEFRVNSSTYSAEYGRTPGGQFSFATRSGTDSFHGSIYDYLRNNFFDANNWFSDYFNTPQPALRQNDFGGTLGGPVRIPGIYDGRGKTFFFASYEGLRLTQPQAAQQEYVPSLSLRTQAPSVLQPILNAFPLPTPGGIDYGNGLADFIQADSLPSQIDATSIRMDQVFSSKLKLFFRFGDTPSATSSRSLSVYEPTSVSGQTYTLGVTFQPSSNLNDEFRLGYATTKYQAKATIDTFGGAQPINLAEVFGAGTSASAGALFLYCPYDCTYLSPSPASSQNQSWNLTDAITWVHGKHNVKVGIDFRSITAPVHPESPDAQYQYFEETSVINDQADLATGTIVLPDTPIYRQFSAFGQDEWRPTQNLTLSFGLRWDVNPPPGAKDGNVPYTLQGNINDPSTLTLAPHGTALWKTTWYNLAPRLGAAWIVHNNRGFQTVVRAGGGVFFDTGNQEASGGYDGPGFSASVNASNAPVPFPGGFNFTPSLTPPYTNEAVYYYYPHFQLPYTLEWSGAIEQGLGQAQTFTLSYIASNGRRLLKEYDFYINAQNPDFGSIVQYGNGLTSNYQSLQAKFQRTIAHGLQALASYTWSHSIDYGSSSFFLPDQRGNSDFDVRNNFTMGATWQIPKGQNGAFTDAILNGWALDGHFDARTAFPVSIVGQQTTDPYTGSDYYLGVNLVPNQPIYLHEAGLPGGREVNRAAFANPPSGQIGTAPRNFVRGFGATQLNLAVRREFPIHEGVSMQFRAESFNILNHPNFGYINPKLTSTTFGQATETLGQSLTTVSPLYQMGGPRSMQFALKLQF